MKKIILITLIFILYYSACAYIHAMSADGSKKTEFSSFALIAALTEDYEKQQEERRQPFSTKTSPTLPRKQTPKKDDDHVKIIGDFKIVRIPEDSILEISQPSPQKPEPPLEKKLLGLMLQAPADK
jgi:hypothetical protein